MSTETSTFVDLDHFDTLIRKALAKTYAFRSEYDNESDFKLELFHNLYSSKMNGRSLGVRLPGSPTCALHAEAKAENGNPAKADLLICNPGSPNSFNYSTEVIIELKETLTAKALRTELDKFARYSDRGIRHVYLIPANRTTLSELEKASILKGYRGIARKVTILDRSLVKPSRVRRARNSDGTRPLEEQVSECIRQALNLYGKNRKQYHGFFWCNYEHETSKGWTFPVEGDFNAQLYHRLRSAMPSVKIRTEYKPSTAMRSRSDFLIANPSESVGLEVKMNWDQFKLKPQKAKQEADSILEKFEAMHRDRSNHSNVLVVIQGEDGHKSNNKSEALKRLRGKDFSLFYYDENIGTPVGQATF